MGEKLPDPQPELPLEPERVEPVLESSESERELSPEIIEMIMEKVQDIDKKGTAYHMLSAGDGSKSEEALSQENIASVLHSGLLSGGGNKLSWKKHLRAEDKSPIHFNIVGRATHFYIEHRGGKKLPPDDPIYDKPEIARSNYSQGTKITILFDLSSFSEISPYIREYVGGRPTPYGKQPIKTYRASLRDEQKKHLENTGEILPDSEYGFLLSHRVAPRKFLGIITTDNSKILEGIIKSMEDSEILLPIYDYGGNLLWPKEMNYEDVKNFVQERDKNKKENQE